MPGCGLPDATVLLGTVGEKATPVDATGSAEGVVANGVAGVAAESTGDRAGAIAAAVWVGGSFHRAMPTIASMHRVARVKGSTLFGVGLAAFLVGFRIEILPGQRLGTVFLART
jgi:hypothetical protein